MALLICHGKTRHIVSFCIEPDALSGFNKVEVLSIVAVLTRSVILEARTGKAEVTAPGFLLPSRWTSLSPLILLVKQMLPWR